MSRRPPVAHVVVGLDGVLPPPITEAAPLSELPDLVQRLGQRGQAALAALIGDRPIRCAMLTRTKVDVGRWLYGRRAWILSMEDQLLIFAADVWGEPIRFHHRAWPYSDLAASTYNHITGSLVLARDTVQVTHFQVDPVDGLQLLAQILYGIHQPAAAAT